MKTCKKCNELKPIESFTIDARYKDGRYPWCFECRRAWRQGRKDRQRELHQNWSDQNRDKERQRLRDYYQQNEEARKRNRAATDRRERERLQSDPEFRRRKTTQAAAKNRRRKAALYGAPAEHHTEQEWVELCARYDHRCLCCNRQVLLTRDHIVPVCKGGSDAIANIQPLCFSCNSRKGGREIDYRLRWGA